MKVSLNSILIMLLQLEKKISNIKCSTVFLLLNIKQCLEIWIRWPRFWLSGSGSEKICRSTDPDPMGKISNRQNIQCAKYLSKTAKKHFFTPP